MVLLGLGAAVRLMNRMIMRRFSCVNAVCGRCERVGVAYPSMRNWGSGGMATIEQVREREEAIVTRFQTQSFHRGQFTETARRAAVTAIQGLPTNPRPAKRRSKKQLPLPSKEAKDFILRALSNPNFQRLIERLANE
jgi:hypothetical protein